ncbi:MAG: hypothetical protein MJ252_10060 [archaeon]|nr:hypothetical protein [archaeon]
MYFYFNSQASFKKLRDTQLLNSSSANTQQAEKNVLDENKINNLNDFYIKPQGTANKIFTLKDFYKNHGKYFCGNYFCDDISLSRTDSSGTTREEFYGI